MANISRTRRIDEQLKQELSLLIRREIGDSRVMMISITLVKVVRDLSQAKVLVTYLGPVEERAEMVALLNEYAPLFQRMLGKVLKLRKIPKFEFVYDEQLEKGNELSALITEAVQEDEARHKDHDE
ncbi:30S ribosome-binding factor RbfA [Wohlfahrtiimonas chitiniclastica]|uniref:30S ribosome-binding factor RbfA n=1 Tax=Wohlfahrtiimonas chitiniclastica TaxID=400946 RepID=UPI00036CDBEB|nr:30S ribosome-binding factor RbfA [Wohlfahrtiimonas chitiniclastica]